MDKENLKQLIGELPGMTPPPGEVSNLINPPTMANINLLCQVTCLTLSTLCVLIRMFTKIYIIRSHGWEDYACFVAWLGLLPYSGMQLLPIFTLFPGVHQWNVKTKYLGEWGRLANIIATLFGPTIFFAKLSILLLYFRIFVTVTGTKTYYAIHIIIWSNLLFYISNLPAEIWACVPRRKIWDPTVEGTCINNDAVLVTGGVINVVTDFVILFLPLVSVIRLQMPLLRKIGVCAVFATGFFACICSVMHLVTAVQLMGNPDKTYRLFPLALWTSAEIASGIICSSLLTMPHFFRYVAPRISSRLSSSRKNASGVSGSGSNKVAPALRNPSKPPPQWHDLYDTTTSRQDNYLELNESSDWHSPTTTIQGGARGSQNLSFVKKSSGRRAGSHVSQESAMESGIIKTVRVEQYPVPSQR